MLVETSFFELPKRCKKGPDQKRDSAISFQSEPFQTTKKPPQAGGICSLHFSA